MSKELTTLHTIFLVFVVIPACSCPFVGLLDVPICCVPSLPPSSNDGGAGWGVTKLEAKRRRENACIVSTDDLADLDLPITKQGFTAYLTSDVLLYIYSIGCLSAAVVFPYVS